MFTYRPYHLCEPEDGEPAEGFGGFDDTMAETLANLHKGEEQTTTPTEQAPSTEQTTTATQYVYPKTWKPDHAQLWETTPEAIRAEALRREEDFHRGIEQYKSNATVGERYAKLWERYNPVLQQHGVQAEQMDQMVQGLLNAQFTLALGTPEEKLSIVRNLISEYKIDPKTLLEQAAELDPNLAALQSQVQSLQSKLTEREQAEQRSVQEKARAELEAFTADKPDFNLVANHVAAILQADPKATLQDAYDQAIWANPATREKAIQAKAAADAKAKEDAERERAAKAAAATSGSVRTPSRSASETAASGSMDDTMKETLRKIRERG